MQVTVFISKSNTSIRYTSSVDNTLLSFISPHGFLHHDVILGKGHHEYQRFHKLEGCVRHPDRGKQGGACSGGRFKRQSRIERF